MIVPLFALGGSEIARNVVGRPERIFKNTCETVIVQATRLDTLIDSLRLSPKQVAFVWCDVQGSEGAVIRTGLPLWHAGVPLWAEIAPLLLSRLDNLKQFIEVVNQNFYAYVTRTDLESQGIHAQPRPIASFKEFVEQLTGEEQMDVLFLPH